MVRDELEKAIADQILGIGASEARAASLRRRLELMQDEFAAIGSESPMTVRDRLAAILDDTKRAARAVADAPDMFEDVCREVTGASSTALALMLHDLSERVRELANSITVRKVRSEAQKKLCAWFAWQLFDEFSDAKPTLTPYKPYIAVSEFMAELLLGEPGLSMDTACREVIKGRFPGS